MSTINNIILILCITSYVTISESYRILGVFPYNGISHNVMFNALMKGLAKRGHQVDHITHWPLKNVSPNYKVIINLNGTLEGIMNTLTFDFLKQNASSAAYIAGEVFGNKVCELMGLKEMQRLIKNPPNDPPYDVVITEVFGSHCFAGFGHILKVPVIAASSALEYPWISDYIGNNDNLALVPNVLMANFEKTNFWHRLKNVISYYWYTNEFHRLTDDIQTALMRKYLSPDIPNIREVERNIALTLVNSHPVMSGARPVIGSLVEVGGLHVEEVDLSLPPELKKWLDESIDGVVYFSFGSLVLIETLPEDTIKAIYNSFSKISPMRVLMKIYNKEILPPGLPKNILTLPWIPQQAVLAHKNVRVFITHGGLMGSQEALYYGVPIIGMPLFADQPFNVNNFVKKNMGLRMDVNDITTESLDEALNEIRKSKYSENAKLYSRLFKDRPMSAVNTAIFWTEYIIRNGPIALKSSAFELYWWQLALLDVYGFLLLSLFLFLMSIHYISKILYKYALVKNLQTKVQ